MFTITCSLLVILNITAVSEYGFEDFIKSVMLYVGVGLGISLITFIFKVRQDEL